mgnify:CR=1 FL=1
MKRSKWLKYLDKEKLKKKNKGLNLAELMKVASKTYKKK